MGRTSLICHLSTYQVCYKGYCLESSSEVTSKSAGMIASGPDKDVIENLVTSYIEKPSCIILLAIACESRCLCCAYNHSTNIFASQADWENQRGFDVAQKYDPKGVRTIGESSR